MVDKVCERCGVGFKVKKHRVGKARFCSQECYHQNKTDTPTEEFFLRRVGPPDTARPKVRGVYCTPWTGKTSHGYGVISRANARAHVYAWELYHQTPVPEGMFVCHHCDNPACVNPIHLFLGTPADNIADAVSKGRIHKGERCWQAKLTEEQVRSIRVRYVAGGVTQQELADEYGVSQTAVGLIVRHKNWAWLVSIR